MSCSQDGRTWDIPSSRCRIYGVMRKQTDEKFLKMPEFVCFWQKEYYNKNRLLHFEKMSEKPERRFDMKTKKKRIAQEIQSRILTIVIAIFMVVAVVVAVMVGNVSLSA